MVEGRAFVLHPDTPRQGVVREGNTPGEPMKEPLRTAAEEAGLIMRRPPLLSYTLYALEATEYAQERGQFDSFHRAAYRAYWEHGKDLGDLAVIREIAKECGMDWPEMLESLEKGHYRKTIYDQFQEAVGLGIKGIPAFHIGRLLFTGAQEHSLFKMAMEKALAGEESA